MVRTGCLIGALVVTTGVACGTSAWTEIVNPQDLSEARKPPVVVSITDLGGMDVPIMGILKTDKGTDGVAVIGETLWIQGENFGRQPAVQIGGKPATVLSRTSNEGVLVRVPPGVPPGLQPVVVSHEYGRGEKMMAIRRLVATLPPRPGWVAWADLTSDGPVAVNFADIFEAHLLRMSADGRAAYVIGGPGTVMTVFELTAPKQPAMAGRLDLGAGRAWALVSASSAHLLGLVRDQDVLFMDTSSALRPARRAPVALPPALKAAGPRRVEISPDGKLLAFLVGTGNQVVILDISRLPPVRDKVDKADKSVDKAAAKAVVALLPLEPALRAPVLTDLAFSPDGKTLWVISGDNADSRSIGPQPTKVYAVRVVPDQAAVVKLELARTVTIESAVNPVRVSTGRNLPLASGATIRLPPEKATVYVTATARTGEQTVVYAVGAEEKAVEALVAHGKDRTGGVDVSPDGRWLMAGTLGDDGSFRIAAAPADGRPGSPHSVSLVEAPDHSKGAGMPGKGAAMPAGGPAEIRVQP